MTSLTDSILQNWNTFYELTPSYYQPSIVDLKSQIDDYAFSSHFSPEVTHSITNVLDLHFEVNGIKISDFLQQSSISTEDKRILKQKGFQLSSDTVTKIVLEHPLAPNFLIKKNFSTIGLSGEISRFCSVSNIPFWLSRYSDWFSQNRVTNIKVPNDALNPLRVVMLKRAKECIKNLNLNRVKACREYLFPIPGAPQNAPLHHKYTVISQKVPLMNEFDSINKFINLAKDNPQELREIITQICLVIKHTHLTDMHINNIRFAADGSNKVYFFDGEPVGGLADISEPEMRKSFEGTDFALFPLVGMRFLQESIKASFQSHHLRRSDLNIVQKIFNEIIDASVKSIVQDRRRYYLKIIASLICPLIPLAIIIHGIAKGFINSFYLLNQRREIAS